VWFLSAGCLPRKMLTLAHHMNALPLLMSSGLLAAAQKKEHASTGMGPFHALSYSYKQLALAH